KIAISQRNVQFVEDYERKTGIGHELNALSPGALRSRHIALKVLRLPGKSLAHCVPGDLITACSKRVALRGVPRALDALHSTDAMTAAQHAQRKAECSSGLPLASAGVDDQQPLFDGLLRNFGILHRLAFGHLRAMALRLVDNPAHGHPSCGNSRSSVRVQSLARPSMHCRIVCASPMQGHSSKVWLRATVACR